MKKGFLNGCCRVVVVLLLLTGLPTFQASAVPRDWTEFEAAVFQLADVTVRTLIGEGNVSESNLAGVRQELQALEQFPFSAPPCPEPKACESLNYVLQKTVEVSSLTPNGIFTLEEGKTLGFLRQAIHNYHSGGGAFQNAAKQTPPQQQPAQQQVARQTSQNAEDEESPFNFSVGYFYRPQGQGEFRPLEEGGSMSSGDQYKIYFRSSQQCYVYVFQVDTVGVYGLFPLDTFRGTPVNLSNPVQPEAEYLIPGPKQSFVLDQNSGSSEQFYILVMQEKDAQFEQEYAQLVQLQNTGDALSIQEQQGDFLVGMLETKGPAYVNQDNAQAEQVTFEGDGGQTFDVLIRKLQNCDDCVSVLTFMHK